MSITVNAADYVASVEAVREYLSAEMDAASPSAVVAYCETSDAEVVELTLSDLVSVAHLAFTSLPHKVTADGWCATHSTGAGPVYCEREVATSRRPPHEARAVPWLQPAPGGHPAAAAAVGGTREDQRMSEVPTVENDAPTDDEVEAGAKALFEHFHRSRRYGGDYQWPAPEQHLPWWRDAARAVLAAVPATETAIERAYDNGREDHRAHDCCQTRPIPPATTDA